MQQNNHNNHKSGTVRPTIGVFIENTSDLGHGYYAGLLDGINASVQQHDAHLLCFAGGLLHYPSSASFYRQRNILYQIASPANLDGLIIISALGNESKEGLHQLCPPHYSLPTVSIGAPIEGTSNVTVDHKKGMSDLLVHLIESHNYRRIAYIAGPEESLDAQIRYQVYKEVLAHYDIPYDPALVTYGRFTFSSGIVAARLLLDQQQASFDVIVAANDHMATGAMEELQARGIVVPYDMPVVGFDDIKQTRDIVPPVTTVRQPLYQMGKAAVNMLLTKIAKGPGSEQIIFPTELVVRRSCGCFMSPAPSMPSQSAPNRGVLWTQLLSTQREAILSDLVEAVDFSSLQGREGAAKLLDGFYETVISKENGRFLSIIDRFLRTVMSAKGDITSWQVMITGIHRHLLHGFAQDDLSLQARALLHEAQVFITGELRRADTQKYVQAERQNWTLHEIGQALITMFDLEGLMDTIAKSVPRLGIPSCYLVLYEDARPYNFPQPPPKWSRLVLATDENGRVPLEPEGRRFLTTHLLPEGVLPVGRRYTMIIEPLHFREEQIGLVLLERGPHEGNVYEVLRGQLASALKGALLMQAQKQTEGELREHRDHLDELVQARTAELATTNEYLRQEIEDRIQIEKALQESEENLHATLYSIGDAVIATDTESNIIRMNPMAEKLTGWTFAEANGRPLHEVFTIKHAQTGETAVNPVNKVLKSGKIVGLANHTMLLAKDNNIYLIADSAAPIRDSSRAVTGVVLVFRDVTKEYRMQEALREGEAQLRTLIETIPDLVWLKDQNGVFLICNSKVERLYGAKESDIAGKTDYDFVDKKTAEHFRRKDMEAMAAGKSIIFEEEVTYASDGHREFIETVKTPMYSADGKLLGVLGIAHDITERKRAEEELRESKKMLSNVLNTIPVRVFWKNLDGVFLGCNLLFAQDVGKNSPEEVIGIDDYHLSSAEQAVLYRNDDRTVIENGIAKINYEEPQTTAEGTLAWLNTSKVPLRNSNGDIYGVLGTYEDITERKRSEQLVRENNERLQLALQAASMGTWEWNIVKNHMVWSPETLKVFGIRADEFGGTYEAYLAFATPESRREVDEKIQSFLRDSTHSAVIHYEHKIIRGDSASGWVEMRGALFLDHTDQPVRMIGVCADVSARKEIAVQLEAYTAELERSNRELQEFAYVASHDLQEPLRKIQTFGDRLQNKYNPVLDERGQDYLERMQNAAARMQALIVDLLSFSRVRTHGQPFGAVDLHQTVLHVLQDLEIKIAEVQAEIVVTGLLVIEADALQMKQLFQNLLSNALKFHRPGIPLKINVSSRVVGSVCEIVVTDNGIGFDEKYTDRIFIVFERLHGRDVYPGTGVGLAICRRIVERHNGYIRAQSNLGEGSTFIVGIPVKQTLSDTAANHKA